MFLRRLLQIVVGILLFATADVCYAQDEDLRGLSIEELMGTEVISATQTSIPLQEAPSTVYVITGEQIQRWGIRRLSELIERIVPGAMTTEDGDDLILGFRGISADNNAKVLLLLNGHYYNTQWNNGPSSEIELGLLQDVKKVEIVNGPGSALYGAGAILAVINLITKSGNDFQGVEASANYGTGDYRKADLTIGGIANHDTNYFVSMGGLGADGYDNNDRFPLNISRYEPGYRFYADVNYKDFELMSRFTRSERSLYNFPVTETDPIPRVRYDTFFVDLEKTFQPNDELKLLVNVSYDTIQTHRHDYRIGLKIRAVGEDRYGFKTTGFYQGLKNNDLVFGVEYRRDEFGEDWTGDNFNILPTFLGDEVGDIPLDQYSKRTVTPYGRNAFGIFGQDIIKLNEKYSLLVGLRVDGIEAPGIAEQWAITPRVALVYKAGAGSVIKGMYTSGFRQPIGALTSRDGFAFGSQGVNEIKDPEKMNSFELTFSHNFQNNATIAANVFYNILSNIHVVERISLPTPLFVDTGRIDFVGFEAMAGFRTEKGSFFHVVHQNVQLGGKVDDIYGIHSTLDKEHVLAYPENVTKFLFETGLTSYLNVNTNAVLVWNSFGLSLANEIQESGSYLLLNAGLVWKLNSSTKLLLHGYNLTNEQNTIPLTINNFTVLAKRNFNISVDFRF